MTESEIRSELHSLLIDRMTTDGKSYFSLGELVLFCLAAAASGVIGNLAYDVLKVLVIRIVKNDKSDPEAILTRAVRQEDYERLCRAQHGDVPPVTNPDPAAEEKLVTKYRLLVGDNK